MAKQQYLSVHVASADICTMPHVFWGTCALFGRWDLVNPRGEIICIASIRVTQICSWLSTDLLQVRRRCLNGVIWEWLEPFGLEEVIRVLRTMSSAIGSLDPCPSWLAKAAWVYHMREFYR